MVLTLAAGALTLARRLEEADLLIEQALALDPWLGIAWIRRGWASAYRGDADAALRELTTALHIMPIDPFRHLSYIGIGCAHFAAERYDRAARWVRAGLDAEPGSFWAARVLAAAAVRAGAKSEARRVVKQTLRRDPGLTVDIAHKAWPFPPHFMERLADALEEAGLPRE
jgi:tetratricopeptide (TPR) repeat protein